MVIGLKTSASAMESQAERLAILANNLANVGAVGFKADHLEFFQLLTSPRAAGPASTAGPAAPLTPPPVSRVRTDYSQGPLRDTGAPLDVALEGPGFFVIGGGDGPRLTRAGSFVRTGEGTLATPDGAPVLDTSRQPLRLPSVPGPVRITEAGDVLVGESSAGKLLVVRPASFDALTREAGSRFAAPAEVELTPVADARVRQGVLEQSNVNPVLTLVEMIEALRIYEAAQRSARATDETLGRAVNDVGRT
jgi:flagellar basal body rod protein FlgG